MDRGLPRYDADGQFIGYIGSCLDITEERELRESLRELNATLEAKVAQRTSELQALNQSLESFVYSVSHDLKAPLRGVEGYSRLLEEEHTAALNDEGRLFIQHIREGVSRMNKLIDDLLAYSRMERRALAQTTIALPEVLQTLLQERELDLGEHGVSVTLEAPATPVLADPDGLAVVLRNLLDNALKFSAQAQPPRITIGGREEGNEVIVWVQDNGVGFDMKYHDRIFDIFQRLHRQEDYPGTGIGLALVKKAVQRMGGRVWAESAPGQGATFYLALPKG
jgi:light-regulated signal transduction histidine kinase (bacteriophytochrome)